MGALEMLSVFGCQMLAEGWLPAKAAARAGQTLDARRSKPADMCALSALDVEGWLARRGLAAREQHSGDWR
jgi:hypothetical protein